MQKAGFEDKLDELLLSTRPIIIRDIVKSGRTSAQATVITDQFLMGELRARTPEMLAMAEDVFVRIYTVPELTASLNDYSDGARRSADAKHPEFRVQIKAATRKWMDAVTADVFAANRAAFARLGLN